MARKVAVVAHTHWDREWYSPREQFRRQLVGLLDALLPFMEAHPEYSKFLLDGQMAVVDDYLEVRPAAEGALRRLASEGRLSVGPWYVLMDEFGVSGETIVRNLQLGMARAGDLAAPLAAGYLPDMFGHVAQMPQLLRLAGFEHAVVWRGVPRAVDRTGFWWAAPDGSTVRAEYLPYGYSNGAHLPDDAGALVRRVGALEGEMAPYLAPGWPMLVMNGTDHQAPQTFLPGLLVEAGSAQDRFDLEQVGLEDYLRRAPTEGLTRWTGELRSGARANLLMGVASNRVDIKGAAAHAERAVEKLAEPLAALWMPPADWPEEELADAWRNLVLNSAHDSICACSADEVGRAVRSRYDAAIALAGVVHERALALAGLATAATGPVVLNAGPRAATGLVEMTIEGDERLAGTQVLSLTPSGTEERHATGADLGRVLGELAGEGWLGQRGRADDAEVRATAGGVEITIRSGAAARRPLTGGTGPVRGASLQVSSVMAEAYALAGAHHGSPLRVRVERQASQRVLARVAVPGYGWAAWKPVPAGVPDVRAEPLLLANGLLTVAVDPGTGTFGVDGLGGLDRLVDGGDAGDTYNYSPPARDVVVDHPEQVATRCVEAGPLRGRVEVRRRYLWPARLDGGSRCGAEPVEVVTVLELRAGERLVRVDTTFDNRCRDHRLRAWFPLPAPADHSVAECAFATVKRGTVAEGGPHEHPLATFPSRRFVSAGGLTLTHEGLLEYELVDGGRALALTLLRATGVLSRPAMEYRHNRAGPDLPVATAQMVGPCRARYAVCVGDEDPWRVADLAWLPLQVVDGLGGGALEGSGSRLRVAGAEVSSLRRVGGCLEVRFFNPSQAPAQVRVEGQSGWLVDLRGGRLERWDGGFELRPWGIATARLDRVSLD